MKQGPLIKKGTKPPYPISVVCWVDLLGYGSAMSAAQFNPLHPKAKSAIGRLRRFHRLVAEHSHRRFPTLVMNDGAAAYRDLSLRSNSPTFDFLARAWRLYGAIRDAEQRSGDIGARMVIAAGFRMLGRRAGLDERNRALRSIIGRLESGDIGANRAMAEAEQLRSTFDVVPQLQANFAFTKAYLADQSGTKAGLAGAQCFIDMALFSKRPTFLGLGARISWRHKSLALEARFSPIKTFTMGKFKNGAPSEVRNGLEIGIELANDPSLLEALRRAARSSSR